MDKYFSTINILLSMECSVKPVRQSTTARTHPDIPALSRHCQPVWTLNPQEDSLLCRDSLYAINKDREQAAEKARSVPDPALHGFLDFTLRVPGLGVFPLVMQVPALCQCHFQLCQPL